MRKETLMTVMYASLAALCMQFACGTVLAADAQKSYYTEPPMYQLQPNPETDETLFGDVGASGLQVNFNRGVVMTVDKTLTNTPADGKFTSGQIITGVNGETFAGKNPYCILGAALTKAEATDGKLVFDVKDNAAAPEKKVTVTIPVLGAYSPTWPLNDEKSKKIIKRAAEYYAARVVSTKEHNLIGNALMCLFLLSTGDDQYLPSVKTYFQQYVTNIAGIGNNTWFNGYHGIACAEYYLRTGDKEILPVLQYYCDDAAQRQLFGSGWSHWGFEVGPGYTVGGLMNPAGAQYLTTMLLGKECGVKVDEAVLKSALRFFYRFAGHGTVAYGDHRAEGGLGSNGKDGMIAAAMQVACGAKGDVEVYRLARNSMSMATVLSYPCLVRGHGDRGRGDAIWRGISAVYTREDKPAMYHDMMNRLTWFYDLSRRSSGGFGVAGCHEHDNPGQGAGVALAYTAPLKTLRITGAPRTKQAHDFTLPATIWGAKADTAFLSVEKNANYANYGTNEPVHIPFYAFGTAYAQPLADLKAIPKNDILKNVYHDSYMIRAQAAKALRKIGAFTDLEEMLEDPDPRVRRAALDGIMDYQYWFDIGKDPIAEKDMSPRMIAAIMKMLTDTNEAWYVVDGALMTLNRAPAAAINKNIAIITPWLKHEEWWVRESAFFALAGMGKDEKLLPNAVPAMLDMVAKEYHTMPRLRCLTILGTLLDGKKKDVMVNKQIVDGLLNAIELTEIKPDRGMFGTSAEGAYNVRLTIDTYLQKAPDSGLATAKLLSKRMAAMSSADLLALIGTPNSAPQGKPQGLYTTMASLALTQRMELAEILYTVYRPELMKRMEADTSPSPVILDTVVDLLSLKHPDAAWRVLGSEPLANREWRYTSFNPQPKDARHPREKKRFREVTMPEGMTDWYAPAFDDKAWKKGKAPIGVGECRGDLNPYNSQGQDKFVPNRSDWGEGEFLVMRSTFTLNALDYDFVRLRILAKQGYQIYLNGHKIHGCPWWEDTPYYQSLMLEPTVFKYLKKGTNCLAAYATVEYRECYSERYRPRIATKTLGQIDVYLEGLRKKDLDK